MPHIFTLLSLAVFFTACRPTYKDWSNEWHPIFQRYLTGDVHTAKAALLEEEKLIAKHEAQGNRGLDFRAMRLVLYGHLCGITDYMGQTNEAKMYFQKYVENLKGGAMTYDELVARAKKHDEQLETEWRQQQ